MIDKAEPLFIMMMDHHSRKQSMSAITSGPIVFLNDLLSRSQKNVKFLSHALIVHEFLPVLNVSVLHVCPLLTFSFLSL